MGNKGDTNFKVNENAQEVTEDFELPTQQLQILGSEQNVGVASFQLNTSSSGIASHPLEDILPIGSLEKQELHRESNPNQKRNLSTGEIFKDTKASGFIKSDPNIKNPSDDPFAFWKTLEQSPSALPKSKALAEKASKYLPSFKKPQSQKPKPKKESPSEVTPSLSPVADLKELHSELPELQRAEARKEVVKELKQNPQRREEMAAELPRESQRPEVQDPVKERRSSKSEQGEIFLQHCRDFQDYKRTVNNKQKCLGQRLNLVLTKMNAAMVDAQNLANKIEKVRSQDCDTEETLKIQNDNMKYLVGRTVGTISKIDSLFDRIRTDILEYTMLTTEGNAGIDKRLYKMFS